jgi:hypothetical protein
MKVKVVNNLEDLFNKVEENGVNDIYYLTASQNSIKEFIENSGLDNDKLLNLKLAYNINFNGCIIENNKITDIKSIKDFLEKTNKENLNKIELLIKDKEKIADIIQQFIYLNLHVNVMTEKERKMFKIKQNFDKNKQELLQALKDFRIEVLEAKTSEKTKKNKEEILERIGKLEEYIKKLKNRKLKIAVMATKKTGKSVIVNSFLQEEFAPTSLSLATPNSIIYEEWENDYIEVKVEANKNLIGYEKEIIKTFKNVKDTKHFLYKLFKKAEDDKENDYTMPDIYIKYPTKNNNFILIDTPGPDLAGAKHNKVAYEWLKKADVVIFAMDYTKYLTDAEKNFLKDVKEELRKQQKFYSLIVTLNKLDMRYQDPEKKTVIDKLHLIRKRLIELDEGFRDVTVMGTSSLQYFYAINLIKLLNKNISDVLETDVNMLLATINPTILDEEGKTNLSVLNQMIFNLRMFHQLNIITVRDILEYSGMPYLIQRANYIAQTKAGQEIFNNIFSKIDREFNNIKNEFLIEKIKHLLSKKNEIESELNDMEKFFEKKQEEAKDLDLENLKETGDKILSEQFNELWNNMQSYIESNLEDFKDEIIISKEKKLLDLKTIIEPLSEQMLNAINNISEVITKEKNDLLDKAEENIININNEIKTDIKNRRLQQKYNLDIQLSDLDPSLAREEFELDIEAMFGKNAILGKVEIDAVEEREITKTKEVFSIFKLLNPFVKGYTELIKYTEKKIYVDENKLDNQISEIQKQLENLLAKELEEKFNEVKSCLEKEIDKFNNLLQIELNKIIVSYKETNDKIRKMFNSDLNEINDNIEFFNQIKNKFDLLNNKWENIKKI